MDHSPHATGVPPCCLALDCLVTSHNPVGRDLAIADVDATREREKGMELE